MGRREFWKPKGSWERSSIFGETKDCGNDEVIYYGLMGTTRHHGKKEIREATKNHGKDKGIM